jgi:hypothetical protein
MENALRPCSIQGNGQTDADGPLRSGDSESAYHQQSLQSFSAVRDATRPDIQATVGVETLTSQNQGGIQP